MATLYSAIPQDGKDHDEEAIHAIGLGLLSGFSLMLLYVVADYLKLYPTNLETASNLSFLTNLIKTNHLLATPLLPHQALPYL